MNCFQQWAFRGLPPTLSFCSFKKIFHDFHEKQRVTGHMSIWQNVIGYLNEISDSVLVNDRSTTIFLIIGIIAWCHEMHFLVLKYLPTCEVNLNEIYDAPLTKLVSKILPYNYILKTLSASYHAWKAIDILSYEGQILHLYAFYIGIYMVVHSVRLSSTLFSPCFPHVHNKYLDNLSLLFMQLLSSLVFF